MPSDREEWHVTTDPERVRSWAEARDAVPVREDAATSEPGLAVVPDPADREGDGLAGAERLTWDQFADRFEAQGLAFEYRDVDPREAGPASRVLDREDVETTDAPVHEGSGDVASDTVATSDTGENEPVVEDRVESTTQARSGSSLGSDPAGGSRGSQEPARLADEARPRTTESESASGAETQSLVLEELYEDPGFSHDVSDEYLVLRNVADEPLDLGGWRVENGLGRRYDFPAGTMLEPGETVTLHSGSGEDADGDLYWGADRTVWREQGGVVVVRAPDGSRVIREPYKDGPRE